jgi:dTDP-4-dehydrorhamnose reductase
MHSEKILILGHTGMLGHMVKKYLDSHDSIKTETIEERWPEEKFKEKIIKSEADFIINCIGAIPQRVKEFEVNTELPIWLEENTDSLIIHPGTDCEIDNDQYGNSKRKAAEYLIERGNKTKIIKTSIIGPELRNYKSLMEWFLSHSDGDTVSGYTDHYWNGNTTLTWAKFSLLLIKNWYDYRKLNILTSDCVSKFQILKSLNKIYGREIIIKPLEKNPVNKCLPADIKTQTIEEQILELKEFYAR